MDYLVYAYLQGARPGAAKEVLRKMAEVTVDEKARSLPVDYAMAATPARFALEQRRWEDAAASGARQGSCRLVMQPTAVYRCTPNAS